MKKNGSLMSDLLNMDVLFGILLGGIIPFFIFVFMQANAIRVYQGLITGILALVGAGFTLFAIRHQIRHAQEVEDDRLARRMFAARAMMPHALSALCSYARDSCAELKRASIDIEVRDLENGGRVPIPKDLRVPKIPDEAMATMKECLQFGGSDIQIRLAEYTNHLQIQNSRLNGLKKERDMGGHWYYALLEDAIAVYARSSMLFDYSRGEDETVPGESETDDLKSAANICEFRKSRWRNLHDQLGRDY